MLHINQHVMLEIEENAVRDIEIENALYNVYTRLGTDVYPTPEVVSLAAALMARNDLSRVAVMADSIKQYLATSNKFVAIRGRKGGLRKVK